ncbi:uncharacterized protein K441DRAFT_29026 [Cenococcum geophilum 1.58]|uniref:uncharacterized protein n=1 Tax=Cenococcum geophilum 1.58 TaxID=794803 RepID=UPI00358FB3E0|nr:hypothetical protein K441DRAFT_29026 [Cenococcum geophilum 1.58]
MDLTPPTCKSDNCQSNLYHGPKPTNTWCLPSSPLPSSPFYPHPTNPLPRLPSHNVNQKPNALPLYKHPLHPPALLSPSPTALNFPKPPYKKPPIPSRVRPKPPRLRRQTPPPTRHATIHTIAPARRQGPRAACML